MTGVYHYSPPYEKSPNKITSARVPSGIHSRSKHLGVQIARRGRVISTGGFVQRRPVHAPAGPSRSETFRAPGTKWGVSCGENNAMFTTNLKKKMGMFFFCTTDFWWRGWFMIVLTCFNHIHCLGVVGFIEKHGFNIKESENIIPTLTNHASNEHFEGGLQNSTRVDDGSLAPVLQVRSRSPA